MPPGYPACFESEEDYKVWEASAGKTRQTNGYCWDCTLAHKAAMMAQGRCAFPAVQFVEVLDEDGESQVVGIRP